MDLGALEYFRRIQAQYQNSISPFIRHQQMIKGLFRESGISKIQKQFAQNNSSFSMMSEIAKNLNQQNLLHKSAFSTMDTVTKPISWQSKLTIPQTTIDAITSISRQHELIWNNLRGVADTLKTHSTAFAQINNLHFALSGVSGQIAAIAAQQRNWSVFDDFERLTEQAIEFTENLSEESKEEQRRQFQILISLVLSFLNKHKTLGVSALLIIDIFIRFAGIHQYFDFLQEKPETPTKEEVNQIGIKQDSTIYFIQKISEQLRQIKEYRITNKSCLVKLKPKSKTLTLAKLPVDFEVVIIQIHHKWVYISYFDPKDNLPQTGWIMKKYLNNPK